MPARGPQAVRRMGPLCHLLHRSNAAARLFFLRGYVSARFRDSNWLAQTTPTSVFLKFRSYLNYAMPDSDETVVFIPYEEIRTAGLLTERVAPTDLQGGAHDPDQPLRRI